MCGPYRNGRDNHPENVEPSSCMIEVDDWVSYREPKDRHFSCYGVRDTGGVVLFQSLLSV